MLCSLAASAASVSISIEGPGGGNRIGVGDKFYVIIRATNCAGEWDVPSHFPGAQLLYTSQGSSTSTTNINGKVSQTIVEEVTLTLRAKAEGRYTYGPATKAPAKGRTITYTIGKASVSPGAAAGGSAGSGNTNTNSMNGGVATASGNGGPQFVGKGNEDMFLRAELSTANPYEQQGIVYTIKLYTTFSYIKFLGATAAPKFDGFVVEEEKVDNPQMRFETFNGRTYKVATVARYVIFPQKSGKLTVKGNTYTVSADAMEYYHDPIYRNIQVKRPVQLTITPNDVMVNVRQLPTPAPEGFSGGVGNFTITSSLPNQVFKSNNAASIVYTVRGNGNIKYLKMPDLKSVYPSNIDIFEPETKVDAEVIGGRVEGAIRFDYSFMPMETGTLTIPEVKLVYFDPASGTYKTSVARGYTISVAKGEASSKSQNRQHFDNALMAVSGDLEMQHVPYIHRFTYWLWYIIPTLLLWGAVIMRIANRRKYSDMAALRSKQANRMAMKRLRFALACMKRNDSANFYDEMLKALWGYLGDRLGMPTSELNRKNVKEVLTSKHISKESIDRLIGVIDSCEFAKYTGGNQKDNMQELVDEAVNIINMLEPQFKAGYKLDRQAEKAQSAVKGYDIDSDLDGDSDQPVS